MTWNMLFSVAEGVQVFLINGRSMALYFEAEVANVGLVGRGNITVLPEGDGGLNVLGR